MPELNNSNTVNVSHITTGHAAKTLTTAEAARELNRQPQTLRRWACEGTGPIRPVRILGRLHWKTCDIERLLNEGA